MCCISIVFRQQLFEKRTLTLGNLFDGLIIDFTVFLQSVDRKKLVLLMAAIFHARQDWAKTHNAGHGLSIRAAVTEDEVGRISR